MNAPRIEFVPLRDAIASDRPTNLDLLVKIIPPDPDDNLERPPLNIGLVLDRSGSMQGQKIVYARQAASYAVEQLLESDRVSVTIYDDRIETLVENTPAANKAQILQKIARVQPRNMTALHGGWLEGGVQVSKHLDPRQLNRVILLSDGLANVGETNPDVIASDVQGLAKRGVSTTTMGVGDDYNEDLLTAMADRGDGNYYYIESPEQLPDIFGMELQGLMATIGRNVRLRIELQGDVELTDVFNDFELTRQGEYQLPNLVMGNPFSVVLRLKIPPTSQSQELCGFRLSWDDPDRAERQTLRASLQLPVVTAAELEEIPFNDTVREQVALMMAARAKVEATRHAERGDYMASKRVLQNTRDALHCMAPKSMAIAQEFASLDEFDLEIESEDPEMLNRSSKRGYYESRNVQRSHHQSGSSNYYIKRNLRQLGDRIQVIQGDLIQQQVDAIVNPTGADYFGGAVDAAIHAAAGPELRKHCDRLPRCEVGEAQITPGYNLSAQWVIHTVTPTWEKGNQGEQLLLSECYLNSLLLAEQNHLKTVAFPLLGAGLAGFPLREAIETSLWATSQFLVQRSPVFKRVIVVCYDDETYNNYLGYFGRR
jgi:Ca-activated chloride channel family protein